MPTMKNYLNLIYVNLGFIAQITVMMYFKSALEIKENWPLYRCNPPYWFFSDNIMNDFTYCVQNSQMNLMGSLLQPLNYMVSALSSVGTGLSDAINDIREVVSNIRDFVSSIIESVFGVFYNLIIAFQKIIISIKDMMGKIIGIVATILYVLDGSIKTMNSTWNGPPGQLVRALGSCFHPDTKVNLKNGEIYLMKDLPLGAELSDGAKVFSVMKIANFNGKPFYKINGGVNGDHIYVTGDHFVFDKEFKKWIQVKDSKYAFTQEEIKSDWFSCLITTTGKIRIGQQLFWDWEDDELIE
uniref:Hint domain-containing protein n=1 Tax=viral metagenome TaxID=1070528 RepID=A0A6C0KPP8_9ZZZZ